jgi:methionyl-tRNA formyltransferase
MQISVASSSLLAVPLIEAIMDTNHTLASIITTPDTKAGRGQLLQPSELALWAVERDLLIAKPHDTSTLNQHLLTAQPQLIITASYGKLIPVEVLHGPRYGWLNVHFSLLPKWRGAAPVQWALMEGDTTTGISIFKLDKGLDTGPIYFQEEVSIHPEDTTAELLTRMSTLAGDRIIDVIDTLTKGVKPTPQPQTGISLAPKISKEMAKIEWHESADSILRKVRALEERPGTWTTFRGERIGLHSIVESLTPNSLKKPGDIAHEADELLVRCSDSVLTIGAVTPAGKKRMSGGDFARGARFDASERFA